MKIQIKHRWNGGILFEFKKKDNSIRLTLEAGVRSEADLREANLREADLREADLREANLRRANLKGADLRRANLRRADLRGANLGGADLMEANLGEADLGGANLKGANLGGADLRGANLKGADLRRADLRGAKNCYPKLYANNLSLLKLQSPKTKLIAYKYLNGDKSPYRCFRYEIGKTYKVEDIDKDERVLCSKGINLATLEWCLRDTNCDLDETYIECEFMAKDIVVPFNTDGKFRVSKIKILRKLPKKELKNFLKKGSFK